MGDIPPCVPKIIESGKYKNPTILAHALAVADKEFGRALLAHGVQMTIELWDLITNTPPKMDCPLIRRELGPEVCANCPLLARAVSLDSLLPRIRKVFKDETYFYIEVAVDGETSRTVKIPIRSVINTISAVLSGSERRAQGPATWAMQLYGLITGDVPVVITHEDAHNFARHLLQHAEWISDEVNTEVTDILLQFIEETLDVAPYIEYLPTTVPAMILADNGIYFRLDALRNTLRSHGLNPPRSLVSALGSLVAKSARIRLPSGGYLRYYFVPFRELEVFDRDLVRKIRERVREIKEGAVPLPAPPQEAPQNTAPAETEEVETHEI